MLKIHHLNNSRSQRILWLLEELGVPYEIVKYERMSPVPFAPPELKAVHPLGKSPVLDDGGRVIAESGAALTLDPVLKWDFYKQVESPDHILTIQTADQALWANVLLVVGCRTS